MHNSWSQIFCFPSRPSWMYSRMISVIVSLPNFGSFNDNFLVIVQDRWCNSNVAYEPNSEWSFAALSVVFCDFGRVFFNAERNFLYCLMFVVICRVTCPARSWQRDPGHEKEMSQERLAVEWDFWARRAEGPGWSICKVELLSAGSKKQSLEMLESSRLRRIYFLEKGVPWWLLHDGLECASVEWKLENLIYRIANSFF